MSGEGVSDEAIDQIIEEELNAEDNEAIVEVPAKNKGGRPPKLTDEVQKDILSALYAGNYVNVAVEYAGIHKSTFYLWCKLGREKPRSKYGKFLTEVRKAIRAAEVNYVAILQQAAKNGNVDAVKFWLSRKNPRRWGEKSKIELDQTVDTSVVVKYVDDWRKADVKETSDAGKSEGDSDTTSA